MAFASKVCGGLQHRSVLPVRSMPFNKGVLRRAVVSAAAEDDGVKSDVVGLPYLRDVFTGFLADDAQVTDDQKFYLSLAHKSSNKTHYVGELLEVDAVADALLDAIEEALREGKTLTLKGFGTFYASDLAARKGRNPQTGEALDIPASKVVRFRAGSRLKAAVKGEDAVPKAKAPKKSAAASKKKSA